MSKIIENKKVNITLRNNATGNEEIKMMDYKELMRLCVNNPPQGGYKIDDMRNRIRIVDAIADSKNGKVELEDSDVKVLKECVKSMAWSVLEQGIIDFVDEVEKL